MFSSRYPLKKKKKADNITSLIEILRDATWDILWGFDQVFKQILLLYSLTCRSIILFEQKKKEIAFINHYSKQLDVKQVTKTFEHMLSWGNYFKVHSTWK